MTRTSRTLLVILAAVYGLGGMASLAGLDAIRDSWTRIGVSDGLGTVIAVLEILAAVGLLLGLRRPALAIAAAAGIVALMLGAIVYHVRAQDWAGLSGPIVLGLLAGTVIHTARPLLHGGATRSPVATNQY